MANSKIGFSAQFGGRDAATAVLEHFKALKLSAKPVVLLGFPLPELAFILRVDGEVNQYVPPGLGNPKVDRARKYVSIDLCISVADRARLSDRLSELLLSSDELVVATVSAARLGVVDRESLKLALSHVVEGYRRIVSEWSSASP